MISPTRLFFPGSASRKYRLSKSAHDLLTRGSSCVKQPQETFSASMVLLCQRPDTSGGDARSLPLSARSGEPLDEHHLKLKPAEH